MVPSLSIRPEPLKSCPILCCSLFTLHSILFLPVPDTTRAEWSMLYLWALLSLDQCRCRLGGYRPRISKREGLHIKLIEFIELMLFWCCFQVEKLTSLRTGWTCIQDMEGEASDAPPETQAVVGLENRLVTVSSIKNQQWAQISGHRCSYVLCLVSLWRLP